MYPPRLQRLIQLLTRLPGVGEKTAQRFTLFLVTEPDDSCRALGDALFDAAEGIGTCGRCGNIAEIREPETPLRCDICLDNKRDSSLLCVVARVQDLLSIERSAATRGHYFVLGRLLSPLEGIGAEQLPIESLKLRIADPDQPICEVLIATPPSVDGEATALLLSQELKSIDVKVSRIASGVPHGGDIEFADPVTISRAIAGRRNYD